MTRHTVPFTLLLVVCAAAIVAACGSQSSIPAPAANGLPSVAPNLSPTPKPTKTPLVSGGSIGINTFPDGDTATGGQGSPIDNILCHTVMNETYHIHSHLSIYDPFGNLIMIPWGVGIVPPWGFNSANDDIVSATCYYNLHTHDRSGVIHDEAASNLNLTLGQFFDIWGEPLTNSNVAGYSGTVWIKYSTPTTNHAWTTAIDPRKIVLLEHMQITLSVGQPIIPVPLYQFTY